MSQADTADSTGKTAENRGLIMATALLINLVLGMLYAFSIFIVPLENTFGWARHQTALTFSLVLVFFSLGMLTGGNVMAKLGPGRTASLGGLLAAAGFFLASFTSNLYVLYLGYGVMGGYGIGLSNLVPTSVLIRWYPDKRGLATGLLTMSLALGTFFLGTKLSGGLVAAYGWATTFRVIAAVFLVVVTGGGLILKFPPAGYAPPNWSPPAGQTELWGYSRSSLVRTGVCWLVCLWLLCVQMGGLMVIGHVVPFAVEQGVTLAQAALAMGVYAIANGLGRLFFGWVNDRFGLKPAMLLNSSSMAAGLVGLVYLFGPLGFAGLLIAVCLVALGYSAAVPLAALIANNFFGPKFFPKNYGFFTLPGAFVGGLLGPMIGGYIQTATGSYTAAFLTAAALAVLGIAIAAILKPPPRRAD
ncbi:MAG: OFA family MFS transporter [Candidatus Adiutrix sp.]|jgi:OFA family oxalate/formate antiporter-like MFS transporter|nr:OFA family MFS transporter [Candidatus Adiutrix sp.]